MAESNVTKKSRAGRLNFDKPANTTRKQRRPTPPPPSASRNTPVTTRAKLPHLQDTLDQNPPFQEIEEIRDKIPTELPPFTPPAIYKPDPSSTTSTLSPGPPPATLPPFTPPAIYSSTNPRPRAALPHLQPLLNKHTDLKKSENLEEAPVATEEQALQTTVDDTRKELEKGELFESQEPGSLGCGRHALNNLFGNTYFIKESPGDITDLKQILSPPVALQNICKFLSKREPFDKKGDDFCPANENYDINVLAVALGVLGYSATSPGRKWITEENTDDKDSIGYIVNFGEGHWVAFRKMQGGKYKLIDSLGNSSEKSEDLNNLKKENKHRIIDVLEVKFEGKYVDALQTLLTPATTACKFTRGEEVIYTKDEKPIKCVVNGFHWDDNQKCDALILLPLEPPGDEILVKDLENVKALENNSELDATAKDSTAQDSTAEASTAEASTAQASTAEASTAQDSTAQTLENSHNSTENKTETLVQNQKTPVVTNTQISEPVTTTLPPTQTALTAQAPLTNKSSVKPKSATKPSGYVRFGFGSESRLAAAYFNLDEDNTIFRGFPGLNGEGMGTIKDFNDRFTDSEEVKYCMSKYWKAKSPLVQKTISEPAKDMFRVPCDENDTNTLINAFTQYKHFIENKKETSKKLSDAGVADSQQLERIENYLKMLKEDPKPKNCITATELHDKEAESLDSKTLYHSVLPKLFYLMYKHARDKGGVLNIKPIFNEFDGLNRDINYYIDELKNGGPFSHGDFDGVHGMASSVAELFNLLKVLFPGIYCDSNPVSLPENTITDDQIKLILTPHLKFLNDEDLINMIIKQIQDAFALYKQGKYTDAIDAIGLAFSKLQIYIDSLRKKILTASAPYSTILNLLAESCVPTMDEFMEKRAELVSLLNTNEYSNLIDSDKRNITIILDKLESLFREAHASTSVTSAPPIPVKLDTAVPEKPCDCKKTECPACNPKECPPCECKKTECPACNPKECPPCGPVQCKPFIDSAKQELYSDIIRHVQDAFNGIVGSTSKIKDLLNIKPNLEEAFNSTFNTVYNNDKNLNNQSGIKEFDSVIYTLNKYLQALNNKYDKWINAFRGISDPQPQPQPQPQPEPQPQQPYRRRRFDPYASQEQGLKALQRPYQEPIEEKPSRTPGYMRSTAAHNSRLASQGYGSLPSGMEKSKYSGGGGDVSVGPDEIIPLIAEQVAWENLNDNYNSLEPEYKKLLPAPELPPIHDLTEPIHRYIDEYADNDAIDEARNTIDNMTSDEIDDVFNNDYGKINTLNSIYKRAMPEVNDKWIPNMVRADVLRNVASKN